MAGVTSSGFFSLGKCTASGIQHHLVLTPRYTLTNDGAMKHLRHDVIPSFMEQAGVSDVRENGFRMIVNINSPSEIPQIHLIAGKGMSCASPQDWRTEHTNKWDPTQPAPFLGLCAEAAKKHEKHMKFGNEMFYHFNSDRVFGVRDGDPKAKDHILMLTSEPFGTMVDKGCGHEWWVELFKNAYQTLKTIGVENRPMRYIVNVGVGAMSRLHMHVLSYDSFVPKLFPYQYGFLVAADGTVQAPDGSTRHEEIIRLIDERKAVQNGSTPEEKEKVKAKREELDYEINLRLEKNGKARKKA